MLSKLKVKYIQSLGQKKFRDEHHRFVAEGPKTVLELLAEPNVRLHEIYATSEWLHEHSLGINNELINEVSSAELERISSLSTPNVVLGLFEKFQSREVVTVKGLVLALDTIQDPGNLGSIIRIADWFGIKDVICNTGCADIYNPKVIQATMGSVARVNVVYTNLYEWLRSTEARIFATTLGGQDITKIEKPLSGVIVIGNESRGIEPAILALADEQITIPRTGRAESLNAAVATGIILSHLLT